MKKSENTPCGRFWKSIQFLIEPPPDITDTRQRHQARLLSALLLTVILLGGFSGTIQLLTVPGFFPTFAAILGAIIVLCFAYLLARTKYYLVAAMLTALTPFMASYAALRGNTEDQSAFVFMLISVLMSSILLNRWLTLGVALLNVLGLVLLPVIQPAWTFALVTGKVSFHVMISALILISMWHRDLMERDRQKELSESELKFRSIFDHSVDAIGVLRDGVHIMANPAYVRMFGCRSSDSLVGKSILDLITPPERAKIQENIRRRAMGEDVPAMFETRGLRCDGTEFDMEVHVSTYQLEGKLYTVPILRDVTERKRSQEALRASELRYRAIVESTADLICRFLPDTTLTFVNEAYCGYFGRTREQLNGTRFLALIPQSDWAGVQSHVDHVVQTRKPVTYSHEVLTPGGEIRWQQWTDSVILDDDGNVLELQSVGRDITEQKMAEKSLQESERRFTEMLQGVNLAGVMLDKTGRITFINEFLLRLTGWSREDALGKNWFDQFLPPGTREEVREVFKQMSRNQEIVPHYENEILSRHGERRLIRWNNTTLFDTNGETIGSASIGEDITERRYMERSLRLSEEKFSKAFRASPDVIVLTSLADSRILEVNDSLSLLSGYSRDEIIGKTTAELQFWADPADRERYVTMLQRDGRVRDLEVGFRIKSGEIRQASLSGEIIELADGRYILGVIRDITERKMTEQALRSSEERYRALAQNLPDSALLLYDQDLHFIIADGPEIEAAGFTREQLEGRTLHEVLPAQFVELVEPNMRRALLTGEKFSADLSFEDRFYKYSYAPLRDGLGNIVMGMILATNITQLKEVESALKDSQRRLSTALQATKVGVWEWDMRTNRAYWSDENYRVLGLDPGSVESKYENWAKCLHPHDLPAAEAKVTEAINNKSELNIEFRVVWPDESIHWINDIGRILTDEMGAPLGMYGIQMDITKRKQAEEERESLINQLEAKNAELERFTYTVSHDLKSPLVTIKGFLGFIKQDIALGNKERLNNDLERIGNATTKMEELLWDLLELSRIGRLVRPAEKIPFDDLAREASEIVHGQLTARGVTVRVQPNLPPVFGDRPRLVEVLQNLLDNAAKYMGDQPDPLIEIGLRGEENGMSLFFVRDNGMGIAPEHHERIFGLFNKLDSNSEGTGVGLALVKRIIEFHGGRIWVEGATGAGSTFLFTLPTRPMA